VAGRAGSVLHVGDKTGEVSANQSNAEVVLLCRMSARQARSRQSDRDEPTGRQQAGPHCHTETAEARHPRKTADRADGGFG
jgi:hypothetical protein